MQAMRPHLTTLAGRMEEMWAAHKLGTGERNVLCDAMLAASASGGPELRTQVPFCFPMSCFHALIYLLAASPLIFLAFFLRTCGVMLGMLI